EGWSSVGAGSPSTAIDPTLVRTFRFDHAADHADRCPGNSGKRATGGAASARRRRGRRQDKEGGALAGPSWIPSPSPRERARDPGLPQGAPTTDSPLVMLKPVPQGPPLLR